jgi:hypothetical protein
MQGGVISLKRPLWVGLAVVAGLGVILAIAAVLAAQSYWLTALDYHVFVKATRMFWRGEDPYQPTVKYYGPPWIVLLMTPFIWLSPEYGQMVWRMLNLILSVGTPVVIMSLMWGQEGLRDARWVTPLCALCPYTLYIHLTGQLSWLVLIGLLAVLWGVTHNEAWPIFVGLCLVTLKPHIALLPAVLLLVEALRRGLWRTVSVAVAGMLAITVASFGMHPAWLLAWREALISGGYYEWYRSVISLYQFGMPWWVAALAVGLAIWNWWHFRMTVSGLALAITANMIALPYLRGYDLVLLLVPLMLAVPGLRGVWLRVAWVGLYLVAFSMPLIGHFVLGFSIEPFVPPLMLIGLGVLTWPGTKWAPIGWVGRLEATGSKTQLA